VILTDEQKAEADRLKLTYTEMWMALRSHTDPEVWAAHKDALLREHDEWERKMAALDGESPTKEGG
jgi:hypothetical protein